MFGYIHTLIGNNVETELEMTQQILAKILAIIRALEVRNSPIKVNNGDNNLGYPTTDAVSAIKLFTMCSADIISDTDVTWLFVDLLPLDS